VNALQEKYLMRASFLTLSLCLLVIVSPSDAQFEHFYENWRWAHFTTKTGLPSNAVEEIIETDDGTVWVSTTKGIAWYDGYRWNQIDVDGNSFGKRATKICKGLKNNILVILNEKLYSGNHYGFNRIISKDVSFDKVNSACVVDSNKILVTTLNMSSRMILLQLNGKVEIIQEYSSGSIRKTNSNRIWFGNADGLFEYRNKILYQIIPHGFVRSISENENGYGVMSIDSPKDQIGIWEWQSGKLPVLSKTERSLPIRSLDISSNNDVIAAYETGDIRLRTSNKWKELKPVPSQMVGLICLKFSKANDLWIGTENGLYLFRNTAKKWTWWRYQLADPRNIVMEILQTSGGDIWIGNINGVEIRYANGKIKNIHTIDNKKIGLITGIAEDSKGNIWISSGSSFEGAYRWNGEKWRHYGFKDGLNCPRVHKIRNDKNGNLWFLGLAASGASSDSLSKNPGAFMYNGSIFTQINSKNGLLNDRVYSFKESKNGALWFGTKTGLSRKTHNDWKHWGKNDLHNLTSVYSIESDNNNRLWFSTFSSTLGYIDSKDTIRWIWEWVTDSDYKQKVWDLKVDSTGILWVATTRGLFSNNNGVWSSFDIESEYGLKELRVVLPLKDKIYVGGHGIGVGVLSRKKINIPINVVINAPIVEHERVYIKWTVDSYWNEIPSDDIEVRIKLDDNIWSEWNKVREVSFSSLKDGEHKFYLQTKDIYGNVREQYYKSKFIVPPSIYKNPVFYLPFITLVSIIIYLTFRNIRSVIIHKKLIQNQRARIANDLHDEVGSNLGSIALISQRIGRSESIAQTIKDDLAIITETTLQTSEFLRDIVWYINPRYDTFMNLEARLREISGRMLRDMDVRVFMADNVKQDDKFIEGRRNIILMFKEILHNILKHARATKVEIHCDSNPNMFVLSVKDNGVGFNQEMSFNGSGLLSLKRRTQEVGAKLKIISQKGEGTEVIIIFQTNANTL